MYFLVSMSSYSLNYYKIIYSSDTNLIKGEIYNNLDETLTIEISNLRILKIEPNFTKY